MEQINEESQKVIKYLVKASPYGEHQEVLRDLEKLVPVNTDDELFLGSFKEHNEEHLALCPISAPKDNFMVMAALSQNGGYADQARQTFFRVDHKHQKVLSAEPLEPALPEQVQDFVKTLQAELQAYVNKYYREPNGAQVFADVSSVDGQGNPTVHLGYTSKNVNLGNFYGGEWLGKWKLEGDQLRGTVQINAHFFESGNVQFHQNKAFEGTVPAERSKATVEAIIKLIGKSENELQASLGALYEEDMPSKFFKALRRVQPVTRVKMVWNIGLIDMKKNLETAGKNE